MLHFSLTPSPAIASTDQLTHLVLTKAAAFKHRNVVHLFLNEKVYHNAFLVVHHIRLWSRADVGAHTLTTQEAFQYQIEIGET